MDEAVQQLEDQREQIYQQLSTFGDFRLGSISETHTRCGKLNCACANKSHPGHIRYLWNTTRSGKSLAQHLRLGPELDQVFSQIGEGHRFAKWYREVLDINEKICRLRPVPKVEDEKALAALKKTLQRRFLPRRKKKLKI